MHSLHFILTTADTPEEARSNAESALQNYQNDVYDWYDDEGAGRWSDEYAGPIPYRDVAGFSAAMERAYRARTAGVEQLFATLARGFGLELSDTATPEERAGLTEQVFTTLGKAYANLYQRGLPRTEDRAVLTGFNLWALAQLAEVSRDTYTFNSYFYDADEQTASFPTREALADRQTKAEAEGRTLYLVPFDLHN